jgi:hypothetical protein
MRGEDCVHKGAIPAAVLITGYLAFELFTLQKAAHRMEPRYLFEQYVAAGRATELCGQPSQAQLERFEHNRRFARTRAASDLRERDGTLTDAEVDAQLETMIVETRGAVDELAAQVGCDDLQLKTLLKRFEIRARRFIG